MIRGSYALQNPELFSATHLHYAKSGYQVHVYFSGKTVGIISGSYNIVATNLPNAVVQQDCRSTSAYSRGDMEVLMTGTTANMYTCQTVPANAWLRFSFSYISAS